jgi:hypothetical protein
MMRLMQTSAVKLPAASPGLPRWLGAHGVVIGLAMLLIQVFPKQGLGWVVGAAPFSLGFGLAQSGLLAAGGFHRWLPWPVISGASWFSALMAWEWGLRTFFTQEPTAWAWVVLAYALGTGLALHWMGRRPMPES